MDALREEVVHQAWLERLMDEFNAVGNDTRLRILYLLWRCYEVRVNDLATILLLTAPAISQQLKKLHEQSLVQKRRVAQTVYYRLDTQSPLARWLVEVFEKGVRSRIFLRL